MQQALDGNIVHNENNYIMSEIKFRWDIINHLIKTHKYKSYLEIGYYKGWSFDRVECLTKLAVDPNPCKTPEQENYAGGYLAVRGTAGDFIGNAPITYRQPEGGQIIKTTSDDFFEHMKPFHYNWDIIFIDGLHESQQVDRDIQNALKHLSSSGTIVMHDCNPSSYEMTTTGTPSGEWTGDVYKSFVNFRNNNWIKYKCYVINTDYGIGIIQKRPDDYHVPLIRRIRPKEDYSNITWKEFCDNRSHLLALTSVEEFIKRET